MIGEIDIACCIQPWGGVKEFVTAISDTEGIGYSGIEASSDLVPHFEDRLQVFEEIFSASSLKLSAMALDVDLTNAESADYQVEYAAHVARFLGAVNGQSLMVSPTMLREDKLALSDEDWTTAAAILDEMGSRCHEFGVDLTFRPRAGFILGQDKDIKRLMAMTQPELVRLTCDTAELALGPTKPETFMKNHHDRINYVRIRDASGAKRRQNTTSDLPGSTPSFGRGVVNIPKFCEMIETCRYEGWITLDVTGENQPARRSAEAAFRYILKKSGLFLP